MAKIDITSPVFTTIQVEVLTGASKSFQMDLRRRGYINGIDGKRAEYGLDEVARILIFHRLSSAGIGPAFTTKMRLLRIGYSVMLYALNRKGGFPLQRYWLWAPSREGDFVASNDLSEAFATINADWFLTFDAVELARIITQNAHQAE